MDKQEKVINKKSAVAKLQTVYLYFKLKTFQVLKGKLLQ